MTTPLLATLERIRPLDEHYLTAEVGAPEPGWFCAADLVVPGSPLLVEGLARQTALYSGMQPRTAGAFFIGEYVWYVFAAAVGAYLAEQRVPDLAPERLALRYRSYTWEGEGESTPAERIDVRFRSPRCATLPADPAANQRDVTVLPDRDALREQFRTALEAHLTPLIAQIHALTGFGPRAQWNLASDACAALFLNLGKALGDAERAQAEGLAFVKAAGSPLNNPQTGYFTVEHNGRCATFRARGGCCRYYTLPPGEKCTLCVLRPPEERDARLRAYLERVS
jgi:hypothetical protein